MDSLKFHDIARFTLARFSRNDPVGWKYLSPYALNECRGLVYADLSGKYHAGYPKAQPPGFVKGLVIFFYTGD